jgi:glycosyltransferase involved in cell wall biosynthesis
MKSGGVRIKGKKRQTEPGKPLVSVITVVLNGEKHIREAIESVLNQSYSNIEYIVIDGGSSDRTLEILESYGDRIDYWQSEKDGGIYFAMNKGIQLAAGEIIGILNADDLYLTDTVQKIIDADARQQPEVYYGDMHILKINGGEEILHSDIAVMKERPGILHPTCFVRNSVYKKIGMFDTRYRISSDYDFLLRCVESNLKFQYLPEVLTVFRPGGMSASCAVNIEGYKIMKEHKTGHHRAVFMRGIKCYVKTFLKKILFLNKAT